MTISLVRAAPLALSMAGSLLFAASAHAQSFKDVPKTHPAYEAIEFLKGKGVLAGYSDGTFKPDQNVNRAEATKIIVAQLVAANQLPSNVTNYDDVGAGDWFAPYVEAARMLGIIDGKPKTATFNPTRPVKEVEFLKIFLLAQKIDPAGAYGEFTRPLASDVTSAAEWYYPHVRYAISASMIMVSPDGTLQPAKELTRADIAQRMYRFLMYRGGRRTQALLSEAETEILNVFAALEGKDIQQAQYAASRASLAARGAMTSLPNDPLVKAAVKITEGFQALVDCYRAGSEGRYDDAIALAGSAWNLAEQAKTFSPGLANVSTQMQSIAKTMADEARKLKAGQ